jgi:DNA repair protein RadA/Sms
VRKLADIEAADVPRFSTGIDEFDRVLGGGLVAGGVVLIGGDPGIGKSTLLLQALANLSASRRVLYVSGEESAAQIALRAQRLGAGGRHARPAAEISWRRSRPRSRPTSPTWP